jgi:hypothetical protein
MKKHKFLPYVIFGIPILIGIYFIIKSSKKKSGIINRIIGGGADTGTVIGSGNTTTGTVSTSVFPLKRGSKGAKVKELQLAMLTFDKTILPKYGADSDFGSETEGAVFKILDKRTVDNQEDIVMILNKSKSAVAAAVLKTIDEQRTIKGNNIVSQWDKNKSLNLYAAHKVQYNLKGNPVIKEKDDRINGSGSINSIINSKGFLTVNSMGMFGGDTINISAFGVYLN